MSWKRCTYEECNYNFRKKGLLEANRKAERYVWVELSQENCTEDGIAKDLEHHFSFKYRKLLYRNKAPKALLICNKPGGS